MKLLDLFEDRAATMRWIEQGDCCAEIFSVNVLLDATASDPHVLYLIDTPTGLDTLPEKGNFLLLEAPDGTLHLSPGKDRNVLATSLCASELLAIVAPHFEDRSHLANDLETIVRAFVSGQGINHLIETAGDILGLPMTVLDNNMHMVASNRHYRESNAEFARYAKIGRVTEPALSSMRDARLYERLRSLGTFYLGYDENHDIWWFNTLIYADGVEIGHFGSVVDGEDPLHFYLQIAFVAELVALIMQKESYSASFSTTRERVFFSNLAHGEGDEQIVEHALEDLGWELPDSMRLLIIANSDATAGEGRIEQGMKQFFARLPYTHAAFVDGNMIAIVPAYAITRVSGLGSELEDVLMRGGLVCASSDLCTVPKMLGRAWQQASYTFELLLDQDIAGPFAQFEDWSWYIAYRRLGKTGDPFVFCPDALIRLAEHDQIHSGDWLDTLEMYLRWPKDPIRAARELNVHRNTLFYRIGRIRELYGFDLDDGQERARILFGIGLLKGKRMQAGKTV